MAFKQNLKRFGDRHSKTGRKFLSGVGKMSRSRKKY